MNKNKILLPLSFCLSFLSVSCAGLWNNKAGYTGSLNQVSVAAVKCCESYNSSNCYTTGLVVLNSSSSALNALYIGNVTAYGKIDVDSYSTTKSYMYGAGGFYFYKGNTTSDYAWNSNIKEPYKDRGYVVLLKNGEGDYWTSDLYTIDNMPYTRVYISKKYSNSSCKYTYKITGYTELGGQKYDGFYYTESSGAGYICDKDDVDTYNLKKIEKGQSITSSSTVTFYANYGDYYIKLND